MCIFDLPIYDPTEYYLIVLTDFLACIFFGRSSYEIIVAFGNNNHRPYYPFEKYLQIPLFIMVVVSYVRLFYFMLKNPKGF